MDFERMPDFLSLSLLAFIDRTLYITHFLRKQTRITILTRCVHLLGNATDIFSFLTTMPKGAGGRSRRRPQSILEEHTLGSSSSNGQDGAGDGSGARVPEEGGSSGVAVAIATSAGLLHAQPEDEPILRSPSPGTVRSSGQHRQRTAQKSLWLALPPLRLAASSVHVRSSFHKTF